MNQESRMLLAIVLSVLIFVGYYHFFASPDPGKPTGTMVQQEQGTITKETTIVSEKSVPAKSGSGGVAAANDENFAGVDKQITIETPKANITLSTRGGVLNSYGLKEYKASVDHDAGFKNLLTETPESYALGFGLKGYDFFPGAPLYQIVDDKTTKQGARRIVLAWQDKNLRVERSFVFGGPESDYVVRHNYRVLSRTNAPLKFSPFVEHRLHQKPQQAKNGLLSFLKFEQPDDFGSIFLRDKDLGTQINWNSFKAGLEKNVLWGGVTDRYFLIAGFSEKGPVSAITFDKTGDFLLVRLEDEGQVLVANADVVGSLAIYMGPKKMEDLADFPVPLSRAIDYGWFDFVARPILWLMTFFHRFVPNWGLVIILLTFLVKMLLHPVNKKSLASMKAMQQLQPKMKEIQKKHADDRQKLNEEVMQLFRTHKVNPMGGCLPMILQMPIYIALYKVLWNAIELYHSPFLYYKDLSAPDPYFISPVLLGVFMFLQQKLTPSPSMDPMQQKMMMIMPIMFTLFMLFLPVGLVIYIFVNTLMSVVQQYMLQHNISFRDVLSGKWRVYGAV